MNMNNAAQLPESASQFLGNASQLSEKRGIEFIDSVLSAISICAIMKKY